MTTKSAEPLSLPNDPRFEHRYERVNGIRYHYLFAEPKDVSIKGTVVLIHGWPDLAVGWRYQIPLFLELGFRVIAPDMIGYGETDAPEVPRYDLGFYSLKRAASDINQLCQQLGYYRIVLGGHDWGGMVIWRTVLWYPELVTHVFSVCTPYAAPAKQFFSTEQIVKGPAPHLGYQLQLASGEVEKHVKTPGEIRQFLKGLYGGRTAEGKPLFTPTKGIAFDKLSEIESSPIISDEIVDYYTEQYSRNGLHGPLNWYRTRRINFDDELKLEPKTRIKQPTLMVLAINDIVLKPEMASRMDKHFDDLTFGKVEAGHWALWETPEATNDVLRQWVLEHVLKQQASL